MSLVSRQQGFSYIKVMFIIAFVGILGLTGFKLFPVYMEFMAVKTSMDSLPTLPDIQKMKKQEINRLLFNRLQINNVNNVGKEHVLITRKSGFTEIQTQYTVVTPWLYNISLMIDFEHKVEIRGN